MKWRFALAAEAVLLLFLAVVQSAAAAPPQATELDVKAVFLYNFAKFIDWPPQAFARRDSPFTICLAGDPFGGVIDSAVSGESIDGRRLSIRRLPPDFGDLHGCQIVYIGASQATRIREILRACESIPVLTVGESETFIAAGGMIRFLITAGRIHFEINADAAKRSPLKVSSRLLRLADIVHPEDGGGR